MGTYLLFFLPALLLGFFAQYKVKSAYAATSKQLASSGLTGADVAKAILRVNNINDIGIEVTHGHLSDHYDPRHKVLRLSEGVFYGRDLAAVGIAAHEVGHALQDKTAYPLMGLRNGIVPLANIGSQAGMWMIFIGMMMGALNLAFLGVFLYSAVVLFQLVNLPVEYNASARAKKILLQQGMVSTAEKKSIDRVLDAAALTYVAATVGAILTLLYYLVQLGVFANRDD